MKCTIFRNRNLILLEREINEFLDQLKSKQQTVFYTHQSQSTHEDDVVVVITIFHSA